MHLERLPADLAQALGHAGVRSSLGSVSDDRLQAPDDCPVLWHVCQVRPLVGITKVVIELFGSILIANIPESIGTERMVIHCVGGDDRVSPARSAVFDQRNQAVPCILRSFREVAHIDKSGIDVYKSNGLVTLFRSLAIGSSNDKGDLRRLFPEAVFGYTLLFA